MFEEVGTKHHCKASSELNIKETFDWAYKTQSAKTVWVKLRGELALI